MTSLSSGAAKHREARIPAHWSMDRIEVPALQKNKKKERSALFHFQSDAKSGRWVASSSLIVSQCHLIR